MQNYADIKEGLLKIITQLRTLFSFPQQLTGNTDTSFSEWKNVCELIGTQLAEDLLRVAVVGTIKSGKSTFVNSLLTGDYLKRGAGVVTSIVTRIRYGINRKATLFFKSWDHVNSDIEDALVLLPNFTPSEDHGRFDIRRSEDRRALCDALDSLTPDQLITRNARNANGVLLNAYIKGYESVHPLISDTPETKIFSGDDFDAHRSFVGNDSHAVYLTDIELEINSPFVEGQIEIADCQGSDSSNPLHLAMIQDYLNQTHMIIYVVSSRTGVRRADIRFLSMIKKMGILDNIFFVINCDFDEHASLQDLTILIEKTREELSLIRPDPKVFTFSALFHLFVNIRDVLPNKDLQRLSQWQSEKEISNFSDENCNRFFSEIQSKLTAERHSVLLGNHIERLERIVAGMTHWQGINKEIVARGEENASNIVRRIETYQERVNQIRSMMKSTLDGALVRIKKEMKTEVDRFFGGKSDGIIASVVNFIKSNDIPLNEYNTALSQQGFNAAMYQVFQDFRQSLDTFMAETITPKVLGFVRKQENKFGEELITIAAPYDIMIQDAMSEFSCGLEKLGIPPLDGLSANVGMPDVASIKRGAEISFPPATLTLRYSTKIKTEAIFRLGLYAALNFIKQLLKKTTQQEPALGRETNALSHGIRRMRREMEKTILSHFLDYKENIKFQYIIKLADVLSNSVKETLLNRFQSYVDGLLQMVSLVNNKQLDEVHAASVLAEMATCTQDIVAGLKVMREQVGR